MVGWVFWLPKLNQVKWISKHMNIQKKKKNSPYNSKDRKPTVYTVKRENFSLSSNLFPIYDFRVLVSVSKNSYNQDWLIFRCDVLVITGFNVDKYPHQLCVCVCVWSHKWRACIHTYSRTSTRTRTRARTYARTRAQSGQLILFAGCKTLLQFF